MLTRSVILLAVATCLAVAGCTPLADAPAGDTPIDAPAETVAPPAEATDAARPPMDAATLPGVAGEPTVPPPTMASDDSTSGVDASKLSLTETFTNTQYGYVIDYPTGWFVADSGMTVILSSFDTTVGPGTEGVAGNETKIDILALEGFPLDLDARVAQIEAEAEAVVEKEDILLSGGERAVWLRLAGGMGGDTGVVVTILGGELYQLQAYGNAMPLPAIARTLRR